VYIFAITRISDGKSKPPGMGIRKTRTIQLAAVPGDVEQTTLTQHALEKIPPAQGRAASENR
jgi:hypothetical protein